MRLLSVIFLSTLFYMSGLWADVTSWRNGGNGVYEDTTAPINWQDEDFVLWKHATPFWSNACPLIVGDKLFYTAEPTELICAEAKTGEVLWKSSNSYEDVWAMSDHDRAMLKKTIEEINSHAGKLQPLERQIYQLNRRLQNDRSNDRLRDQLAQARKELARLKKEVGTVPERFKKPKTHSANGYTSMTPCSDGQYVYACNGLGIVTKHDLEGNRIWAKVMEKPDHNWGGSASPQLIGGKLIVRFADYVALDPEDGNELWRVQDPQTFGTPASFQVEGEWFIYTARGELIRVGDGKKLPSQDWTIREKRWAFFNSPFVDGNRVYAVHGAAGIQGDVYCMEIPATLSEINRRGLKEVWHTVASKERYYTSPIVHEGLLYIHSMGNRLQALDAATGEILYSHKVLGMRGRAYSGILLVAGKLFMGEENGTAIFVEPGLEFKEIARVNLGENRSTPIFDRDTAYLRTIEHLIAFKSGES